MDLFLHDRRAARLNFLFFPREWVVWGQDQGSATPGYIMNRFSLPAVQASAVSLLCQMIALWMCAATHYTCYPSTVTLYMLPFHRLTSPLSCPSTEAAAHSRSITARPTIRLLQDNLRALLFSTTCSSVPARRGLRSEAACRQPSHPLPRAMPRRSPMPVDAGDGALHLLRSATPSESTARAQREHSDGAGRSGAAPPSVSPRAPLAARAACMRALCSLAVTRAGAPCESALDHRDSLSSLLTLLSTQSYYTPS